MYHLKVIGNVKKIEFESYAKIDPKKNLDK